MAGQSIFISYRRTDTGGHVRSLYERLRMQFGGGDRDRVFLDRSTIESGHVFRDTLRQGVEECAVLLALIGPDWLDVQNKDGIRRLDDPDDFVRREIALALTRGKTVIPVLYDDAPVPPCDRLPDPLKALAGRHALMLRTRGDTDEYEASLQKLIARIDLLGTWEDLRDLCKETTDNSMSMDLEEAFYVERSTVRQHVEAFLADRKKRGFILLGKSGVGKSRFLMTLAKELHARNDMCVLMYAGVKLLINTSSALTDRISNDLGDLRLSGQLVRQVWEEIARLDGIADRRVVFCVDAVNENPQAHDLLRQLDELAGNSWRWPWLKIIFSARPETWKVIKRGVGLAEARYYRETESETPRIQLEPFSHSVLMEYFSSDVELPAAYSKRKLQPHYDELSQKVRDALQDPFLLSLVARAFPEKPIPKDATNSAFIIEEYVIAMEQRDELIKGAMKLFLKQQLLPVMVRDGHWSNVITDEEVIYNIRQNPLFLPLCDADILMIDQQITEHGRKEERIRFKYERFFEHFAGERLFELSTALETRDKCDFFVALIEETARKPFFWGAVRNALINDASTSNSETIRKLCRTKEQRVKEMMVSVLTGLGSVEKVEEILRTLIPQEREASEWQKIRYLVRKPAEEADQRARSARTIAIEVASTLKLVTVLQTAALHTDPTMRALAVRYAYYLWEHNDRDAAFAVLEYIGTRSTTGAIPNCLGLESIFALSLIIVCHSYKDEGAISRLRGIWQGMIGELFRVREDDSRWKGSVRGFIRERLIAFVISHVFRLLRELPANSMMNYEALEAFFRLSVADKDLYRRLVGYFDAHGDYATEQMEQDYFAVLRLDNVLMRLTTTMGLVAHAWSAPYAFLPLLERLFEAARHDVATYPYLRAIHNVPISLLQRNPKMNDRIFGFFVHTAEVCQECYTQHPEKYQGEGSGLPPEAPGIGSYINFQYQREGTVKSQTRWLETRIDAALEKLDLTLFKFLLSAEFPDQAINNRAPQAVLDALELFFKSGNAEITDMIQAFLSRLRLYYPDQVEDFLAKQQAPEEFRLQVGTHEPSEKVGDLIGMRPWYFVRDGALLGPAERCAELQAFFQKAAECRDTRAWLNYVIRHLVNVIYGGEVLRESV